MDAKLIQQAAELLQSAERVVAFTGAGFSTASGIPDFRSEDCGLWEHHDPMQVASIFGFRQNPQAFYDWVRPLAQTTLDAQPNPAHLALVQLEQIGKLESVITQNIDMLHTRAGNTHVFELHGHMREATCIHCFTKYEAESIIQDVITDGRVPRCQKCRGILKPDVILFGEQLPYKQVQFARDAAQH
ncbi:MAG: RNA polymerase subunit sigma, partial [Phototrophicales bacterium]